MKIICNGIPKHGVHALLKALELLGIPLAYGDNPGAELGHYPGTHSFEETTKHIFITRQPKDAFISWLRMHSIPLQTGMIMSRLQNMQEPDGSYFTFCAPYLKWADSKDLLVVRFEDLISKQSTVDSIASYLNVPTRIDVLTNLPGHTQTWNPLHSDYLTLDAWTLDVEKVWEMIGGLKIEKALGYAG